MKRGSIYRVCQDSFPTILPAARIIAVTAMLFTPISKNTSMLLIGELRYCTELSAQRAAPSDSIRFGEFRYEHGPARCTKPLSRILDTKEREREREEVSYMKTTASCVCKKLQKAISVCLFFF